jgi:hypothetical protein
MAVVGMSLRVKLVTPGWGATTFNASMALRVSPLDAVPVTVNLKVPVAAVALVLTRRDTVPAPVTRLPAGKLTVTSAGRVLAASVTVWMKPLIGVTFKVYTSPAPGATVRVEGDAEMEKSGGAVVPMMNGTPIL